MYPGTASSHLELTFLIETSSFEQVFEKKVFIQIFPDK